MKWNSLTVLINYHPFQCLILFAHSLWFWNCISLISYMHYIYIIFKIFKLQFHLERANAEEFHEVYKGVVNEYKVGTNVRIRNSLPEINISIFQQFFLKKFKKKFQQILTLCSLTVQTLIHFHLSFVGHVSTQQNEAFVVGYFNILGLLRCQYFLYRICFCFYFSEHG